MKPIKKQMTENKYMQFSISKNGLQQRSPLRWSHALPKYGRSLLRSQEGLTKT